ncbi:Kinesin motor domain [Dillenia turbinata]|uniref:Kinesin-like protein n=1 Tax=Dillenia turbinata TaxID=194707 RepID=A0AAN8W2Z2_9MAGN
MATRHGSKASKSGGSRVANSPSSSTTSSSKHHLENSIDGQSSPASSSARSKPQYFYSESLGLDAVRSKENVTVTVRFRPLSPREIRQGEEIAWYADGETIVRNEHNPSIAYAYDRVFGPTTTTRHVYDVAAQYVINGAMEGINGTIFAYGVTSSGKTHTMHVVNDLLNPAGQNLRIREDLQGTFVEGIKEEVVLSPAHALSLIAAGEEHRHVGSTNFNLLSSRSHTIFTLTIESSPCGENCEGEAVTLSQLNLIDLAGSESSRAETTGVRRKEGSYINKSLLTLGTVISKLTDGRATHIPYRDSKLTRLLQSSLSGHGRIIDEKSLIKKYQNEIRRLKEELDQLKRGIVTIPSLSDNGEEDIVLLKQKLEDGQVKLQSRLEQEEEAKAALLARIQRLTKLILVSTKSSQSSRFPHRPGPRRRHSFGEEELAYLPYKRRDLILDDENIDLYVSPDQSAGAAVDAFKEGKKTRKPGLLNWLKIRKRDSGGGTLTTTSDKSSGIKSISTPSTPQAEPVISTESRFSHSLLTENRPIDLLSETRQDREAPEDNFLEQDTPTTSLKSVDHIDLLREQQKILSGEVALHSSALKRLSEEASRSPQKEQIRVLALSTISGFFISFNLYVHHYWNLDLPLHTIFQVEMRKLSDDIKLKNEQIASLEKQIAGYVSASQNKMDKLVTSQPSYAELMEQLNEKSFELEVKAADNRVIQEQLNQKICECEELQEKITTLKQQLSDALVSKNINIPCGEHIQKESKALREISEPLLQRAQANEIDELKYKVAELTEAKEQLELKNQKLAEESSYAKGLASAAAVELKALSEEVAKLMNHNERLSAELTAAKNSPAQRRTGVVTRNGRRDSSHTKRHDQGASPAELKRELAMSRERELSYEAVLVEKDQREAELQRKIEESKQREAYLENELANMWVLVAKLKKPQGTEIDTSESTKESQLLDGFDLWDDSLLSKGLK